MKHNIWFTADSHFGHSNILKYSGRPWNNVEEMNDALIERYNSLVKPEDTVYHLGDFCLTQKVDLIDEWLGQLNGTIRLIKGNHDQWTRRYDRLVNKDKIKWIKCCAKRTFEVDGERWQFILSHFPMLFWENSQRGSVMLCGHSHGNANHLNEGIRRMDVGVDCNNWYPVALKDIIAKMKTIGFNPHHDRYKEK